MDGYLYLCLGILAQILLPRSSSPLCVFPTEEVTSPPLPPVFLFTKSGEDLIPIGDRTLEIESTRAFVELIKCNSCSLLFYHS